MGHTEESLLAKGIPHHIVKLPMAYSGRFVAENEGMNGMCKLLIGEDKRSWVPMYLVILLPKLSPLPAWQ